MVSPNVNKILEEARSLTPVERQQFLELLQAQPTAAQRQDDHLAGLLLKKGVVLTIPPKPTAEQAARLEAWKPIEMPGGLLSDDVVRDRR